MSSSRISQVAQQILTRKGDHPRDGEHHRDDDPPNRHHFPTDNNPYPPGHPGNHPGRPDRLNWLLIKVSSTYKHIDKYKRF